MKLVRHIRKSQIIFLTVIVVAFALVHITKVTMAVATDPGTDGDPLVTKSYVDQKVTEVKTVSDSLNATVTDIKSKNDAANAKVAELEAAVKTLTAQLQDIQSSGMKFVPVEMKAGQQLVAGDSSEIILRGGKATAVGGAGGGLSDITSGTGADINTGSNVPLNHLLLVSRDDGRGLKVVSEKAWLLVKGKYTVK